MYIVLKSFFKFALHVLKVTTSDTLSTNKDIYYKETVS